MKQFNAEPLHCLALALVFLALGRLSAHALERLITDCGAIGDGQTVNTVSIQKAIDEAHAQGGGRVVIPSGRFVTGTLYLKSDVYLYLEGKAELLGSRSLADYPLKNPGSGEIVAGQTDPTGQVLTAQEYIQALIVADHGNHVGIEGPGTVDGRGQSDAFPVHLPGGKELGRRPMLMRFFQCRDVQLEAVTLKNPASWGVHLVDCDDVHIHAVKTRHRCQPNNDGIDIDGCRNVFISDSDISSGDDAICPKSSHGHPCENIFVRNCVISSGTAGFKCGTSSRAGFRNIVVSDCVIRDTPLGAIKLECVDGGTLENVLIQNLILENVEGPLFIRLGNRGAAYQTPEPDGGPVKVGTVRNITLSNIRATINATNASHSGIMISGIPGHRISGVKLENIDIRFPGFGPGLTVPAQVPEDEKRYPEPMYFGTLPAYAAYVRHAEDIEFSRVRFHFQGAEARPAVVLDDVARFELKDSWLQAAGRTVLAGYNSTNQAVNDCVIQGSPVSLAEVEMGGADKIDLSNNRLPAATVPLSFRP